MDPEYCAKKLFDWRQRTRMKKNDKFRQKMEEKAAKEQCACGHTLTEHNLLFNRYCCVNNCPCMAFVKPEVNKERREMVNHPGHYGGDTTYEVIKVLRAWGLHRNFCLANTVKYIARTEKEPGTRLEDLKKALWYLQCEIDWINDENN